MLQDRNLAAVIQSPLQYSNFFESTYDVSFDEARTRNTLKDSVSSGFSQGAVEATYRPFVRVAGLVCRYPEALQLFKFSNDEAPVSDSTAGEGRLSITHLSSA